MAGVCSGAHFCCWVPVTEDDGTLRSIRCPHSRDDGPAVERRYVCTLREELGSWEAVRASEAYQAIPGAIWDARGTEHCDVYPQTRCGACGFNAGTPVELPNQG